MKILFRVHALERMDERGITRADVRHALQTGESIEEYPADTPYPSRLVLGWVGNRPLHVVAAEDVSSQLTFIITAYQPEPGLWAADYRRRRP